MTATISDLATPSPNTDDARYDTIRRRDPAADGHFLYAVRTTGVYCRPSCAARLARRENVSFHASCDAAERAGFRPCKRCRPNEAPQRDRQAAVIRRACRLIDAAEGMPALADLAREAGLSRYHFHRLFKQVTGVTPKAYATARRAALVQDALATAPTVTEAIYESGFGAASRFYADAPSRLGMTPGAYRNGGAGAAIRFAIGQCALGVILVAATDRGLCAITFGDDADALLRDLQDRFPNASLTGGDPAFDATIGRVIALVESPGAAFDLPLDIRGTAFQQRVWQALRAIPPGQTASYAAIAAAIGAPAAVRAVAGACAANPLAVAIPCHRVVRSDGALSGYRWGIERKAALLRRESSPS
jgi:AraC family transcriptional regulator of adaptative response/methylated-DNA-[protein]-cysteine methyltransferase